MAERPSPGWAARGARAVREALALTWVRDAPLDLRVVGRTVWHAVWVGTLAGLAGIAFFAGLELVERAFVEGLAGYHAMRAKGEVLLHGGATGTFRPWLLAILPAVGGLLSGVMTRLAPEASGGGGDATIHAYHHGGAIRPRVVPVKMLASVATLGFGGSGGREGPTMQIGGAIGSFVGGLVGATVRERRILVTAGVAAGLAAVFRTPLGAALLAVEMMYRDDLESDGLVPSILASVIAYALVTNVSGQSTLFGIPPRYPFVTAHLPLYALGAIVVAGWSAGFLALLRGAQRTFERARIPAWVKPAVGGLAEGIVGVVAVIALGTAFGAAGEGLGPFGGGYGLAQAAISGSAGLPGGWALVFLFGTLAAAKTAATALTIGSGGSAGDFAPSLVIGGLVGAAFGQAAALVTHDPRIQVGAFALVGMGTFYGGLAHVPLAALVLVAELAGSYDLLAPMMLSIAIATAALRTHTIYSAQPATQRDSPAHRRQFADLGVLDARRAADVLVPLEVAPVPEGLDIAELARRAAGAVRQEVIPVVGRDGALRGLVEVELVRASAATGDLRWAVAADLMGPFVSVKPDDTLHVVADRVTSGPRQVAVVSGGAVVGLVGANEVGRALLASMGEPAGEP